jgi:hypothetical protein
MPVTPTSSANKSWPTVQAFGAVTRETEPTVAKPFGYDPTLSEGAAIVVSNPALHCTL